MEASRPASPPPTYAAVYPQVPPIGTAPKRAPSPLPSTAAGIEPVKRAAKMGFSFLAFALTAGATYIFGRYLGYSHKVSIASGAAVGGIFGLIFGFKPGSYPRSSSSSSSSASTSQRYSGGSSSTGYGRGSSFSPSVTYVGVNVGGTSRSDDLYHLVSGDIDRRAGSLQQRMDTALAQSDRAWAATSGAGQNTGASDRTGRASVGAKKSSTPSTSGWGASTGRGTSNSGGSSSWFGGGSSGGGSSFSSDRAYVGGSSNTYSSSGGGGWGSTTGNGGGW